MFQSNVKLAGLLLLQLIAAAGIYLVTQNDPTEHSSHPLLELSKHQITKVEISDQEKTALLQKQNGRWVLPELHQLPVNTNKIDSALENLHKLKIGWPIATTESSHQRFEVSEEKFQRRIKLFHNDTIISELFLGTSPGFRKVHLRKGGDDKVYSMALNSYDYPTSLNDWLSKRLLAVEDIKAIKGEDFSLQKKNEQWQFSQDSETPIDETQAKQLEQAFNGLTIANVVEEAPELSEANKVNYQLEGDSQFTFTFYHKDSDYYVKRSDHAQLFKMTKFEYDRFLKYNKLALTLKETQSTDDEVVADKEDANTAANLSSSAQNDSVASQAENNSQQR